MGEAWKSRSFDPNWGGHLWGQAAAVQTDEIPLTKQIREQEVEGVERLQKAQKFPLGLTSC